MAEPRRRVTGKRAAKPPAVSPSPPVASGKHRLTSERSAPEVLQPDPLRRLFDELNQPGLERFKQALRSRNVPFTNAQVSDIVKGSASRQIFAPRQRFVGR